MVCTIMLSRRERLFRVGNIRIILGLLIIISSIMYSLWTVSYYAKKKKRLWNECIKGHNIVMSLFYLGVTCWENLNLESNQQARTCNCNGIITGSCGRRSFFYIIHPAKYKHLRWTSSKKYLTIWSMVVSTLYFFQTL